MVSYFKMQIVIVSDSSGSVKGMATTSACAEKSCKKPHEKNTFFCFLALSQEIHYSYLGSTVGWKILKEDTQKTLEHDLSIYGHYRSVY